MRRYALEPLRSLPDATKRAAAGIVTGVGTVALFFALLVTGSLSALVADTGGGGGDYPTASPSPEETIEDDPTQEPLDARSAASAVDGLLDEAGEGRRAVISAVTNIMKCGPGISGDITTLETAADSREDLAERAGELDVSLLSGGQDAVRRLVAAWQNSAVADRHFAAWGREVLGCSGDPGSSAERTAGIDASEEATADKEAFVLLWNPIAVTYGLDQRAAREL